MAIFLSASDIEAIIRAAGIDAIMDRAIDRIETALRDQTESTVDTPVRAGFTDTGLVEWMPVHLKGSSVVLKIVSYFPGNPENGLPTIQAMTSRHSVTTGEATAIVEGGVLTAIRTGATSAVASRALASPESRVLGLIGCGAQAVTQAHAMCRCFPIRTILAHDSDPAALRSLSRRLAFLGVDVVPTAAERIASESDILCTATSNPVGAPAVLLPVAVRAHLHINAVGADFPGKIELPRALLQDALIVPDHRAQAVKEGECQQIGADEIGPDLADLVKAPARWSAWREKRTVFDSTGVPLEDAVMLDLACELARSFGIGHTIDFAGTGEDPRDPYAFLDTPANFAAPAELPVRVLA